MKIIIPSKDNCKRKQNHFPASITFIEKTKRKREKKKKERLSKSDREIVSRLKKTLNDMIVSREQHKKSTKNVQDQMSAIDSQMYSTTFFRTNQFMEEIDKLIDVLHGSEQGFAYERIESIGILKGLMVDRDGYLIKSNQHGRTEWGKLFINESEYDLRNFYDDIRKRDNYLTYEEFQIQYENKSPLSCQSNQDNTYPTSTTNGKKPNDSNVNSGNTNEWGLWKHSERQDFEQGILWKKTLLYKKSIRNGSVTSWDRQSYKKNVSDLIRLVTGQLRYFREGSISHDNKNSKTDGIIYQFSMWFNDFRKYIPMRHGKYGQKSLRIIPSETKWLLIPKAYPLVKIYYQVQQKYTKDDFIFVRQYKTATNRLRLNYDAFQHSENRLTLELIYIKNKNLTTGLSLITYIGNFDEKQCLSVKSYYSIETYLQTKIRLQSTHQIDICEDHTLSP